MIVCYFTSSSFCIKHWTYGKNPGDQHCVLVGWIKFWESDIASFHGGYCCTQDELDVLYPHFLEIRTQQKRSALSIL